VTLSLGKDLLGLEPLSGEQIKLILDTAEPFKEISERAIKKVPTLRGATVVNLFFESSTRTRVSFEFAEKRLSADAVNVGASGSSVTKGETLVDTARNLEAMRIDMVVIRHSASGAAQFLAERIDSNVINAGDGTRRVTSTPGPETAVSPACNWARSSDLARSPDAGSSCAWAASSCPCRSLARALRPSATSCADRTRSTSWSCTFAASGAPR
jgi:hypothetical protein